MTPEQREQIRSNAKYLQNVRPIDPEEIHEYVDGEPHPAAITQVLREEAVDLGLLERADGTFEPVDSGPLPDDFDGVEALPDTYARVLEDQLVAEYGPGWPDGETGSAIRERIRQLKSDYLWQNDVEYDGETALAYALYHLPDYYAASQHVLSILLADGLLPRTLRVLDVGAGVGGPALGLHDMLPDDVLVEYTAVEPSAAGSVLAAALAETTRNFHWSIEETTAEAFEPSGEYDLICFANVLSELDEPAAVVDRYAESLATDGSLVALAPADKNTATTLRSVERAVEDGLGVYAPTVRLWPGDTPTDEGWSFDVAPAIAVPGFQRRLDEAASDPDHETGEFVNCDVQFAYTILRRDGRRRLDVSLTPSNWARMAEMDTHVSNRIDVAGIKLSHDLTDDEGANPLYKVGDGSEQVAHYAVLTKETALNRELQSAAYGDLLLCENVLALWNDDEESYNLVVDGDTVVDRVPADE